MRRLRAPLAGLLTFAMVMAFVWMLDAIEISRHRSETRTEVLQRVSAVRAQIEGLLNRRLYLVRALQVCVGHKPDITQDDFERVAKDLIADDRGIRSMSLARNNTISHVYPYEENRKALRVNLLDVPEQRRAVQQAIDSGKSWLAGPVKLVQGGVAFVNRAPVFVTSVGESGDRRHYWGLVSILIDGNALYDEFDRLRQYNRIEFAVRGTDAMGPAGATFYGDESIFEHEPVYASITLPSGAWQLAGLPEGGWPGRSPLSWRIRLGGTVIALLCGLLVTQILRLNLQYRLARETALEANREKSRFLATMSHEIRTPMNAILGMTELVLDSELTDSQREYLSMVQESGQSLLALINDILDLSKIEAGKLELDHVPFNLRERVGDVMKMMALRAHAKGLELACRIEQDVPDLVVGDPTRLSQILINLVGNATKFTDEGEIVLRVTCDNCKDGVAELKFTVGDTGIGIAEDKLARIFDAFTQADASTTRRFGGTGLGLTISSRLVHLMGGRIWAESELGRGSTFHFIVPLKCTDSRSVSAPRVRPAAVEGIRVLAVDDNATNRLILDETLSGWGMQATVQSGAREAFDTLRHATRAGLPYRLLLTDLNMPEVDGINLIEWIRDDPDLKNLQVIVLTSGLIADDRQRLETLDVVASLMKPVKQSELLDAISMALGIADAREGPMRPAASTAPVPLPPLNILLAEDSVVNQKLAIGLLQKHGHQVTVANNGVEAINELNAAAYDLVLMDVEMPKMDGLEATAAIRAREKKTGTHIPIVAMTAHALQGDEQRCLDAGMDAYVSKPIRTQHLFETLAAVLADQADSTATQKAGSESPAARI